MSMPTSAIAATATGLTWSAGCEPAEQHLDPVAGELLQEPAAICERPALCTQTNSTVAVVMSGSFETVGWSESAGRRHDAASRAPPTSCATHERRHGRRRDAGERVGEHPGDVTAGLAKLVELVNQYAAVM